MKVTDGYKRYRRIALSSLTLIFAFFLVFLRPAASALLHQEARIIQVNDGDTVTVLLKGKQLRSRLIGIDAPELGQEPWGKIAREHLRKLLKDSGGVVSMDSDIEQVDKYNRLLVYLWSRTGTLINEKMLLDGHAVLFTMQPNIKYVDQFRKAQHDARQKKLGIWGPDGLKERPLDYKKQHPRE